MNDRPEDPIRAKRPYANTNADPNVRARKKPRPPASRESRFIGYLVLGFGIVAVVSVLLIAFQQKSPTGKPELKEEAQKEKQAPAPEPMVSNPMNTPHPGAVQDLAGQFVPDPEKIAAAEVKQVEPDLYFKRQPDVDAKRFIGAWQSAIGKYTAVLKMDGRVYQVILADPNEYGRRLYSAGTYKVIEDIIILTPQTSWPKPLPPVGQEVAYDNITTAPFPAIAAIVDGRMLWQNPPRSEKRVLVPYALVITMSEDQPYIVWKRIQ
jgi:hypothetical protein